MIKGYLLKKRKAEAAIESVILAPLMAVSTMLMLYLFLIAISNVVYTNYSNTLAADLNQRQSAMQDVYNMCNANSSCGQIRSMNPGGNYDALKGMHKADFGSPAGAKANKGDTDLYRFMSQVNTFDKGMKDVKLVVNGSEVSDRSSRTYKIISYLYYKRFVNGGGMFPASYITQLDIEFYKNGHLVNLMEEDYNNLTAGKLSGIQITVKTSYRCLGFDFTAKGFNIIT